MYAEEAALRIEDFLKARRSINKGGGLDRSIVISAGTMDGEVHLTVEDLTTLVEYVKVMASTHHKAESQAAFDAWDDQKGTAR